MDEPDNPVGIGSLGVDGIVLKAQELSDIIKESGLLAFVPTGMAFCYRRGTLFRLITGNGQMDQKAPIYRSIRVKLPVNRALGRWSEAVV